MERITTSGKFFRLGGERWFVKGFSYGPFAPNSEGENLPERFQVAHDFSLMRELGANSFRVYFPPPVWLLDLAMVYGLRVFVDVPWEKHRCFFEDWTAQESARERVRETARTLGNHPALFAISVANEIPTDIVRFYGRERIEKFINGLVEIVKEEAPDCLATYVNFPTTEYVVPTAGDFCCFNVYLHDERKFDRYLDRLQHIAGNRPLLLGEYGIDTIREGEAAQSLALTDHLQQVYHHGLAGSYVFAFTDDWFTGGKPIEDWAFGVTRRDRSLKSAAKALQTTWKSLGQENRAESPKVSVVVCSFNGSRTLHECLTSLMCLDYPDYEVILVNDGSTDATAKIAEEFPQIVYHYQENRGLSVARNVGAELATGEIVAYTDDDCVADKDWLKYLVRAMQDQKVDAIGGPNITPPADGWVAKCIAASPGNPSHVMLDDRHAEHVPGCNMAFRRDTLLRLGGFDPQYRQAGDDVDICWRFLDAGLKIGFAAGAMVWHHRRATVRAYRKQQQGYGRSEAMVQAKHARRFSSLGRSRWQGIIYGDGAVGLTLLPETIYHGRFGSALFQTIYRSNHYQFWSILSSLEWHALALFLLVMAIFVPSLAAVSVIMWCSSVGFATRSAIRAPLPNNAPWWCRPLVAYLYFIQPIVRGLSRHNYWLRRVLAPRPDAEILPIPHPVKRISSTQWDLYWESKENLGREVLLEKLVDEAKRTRWSGDFDNDWTDWDIQLNADKWHSIAIRTATEELGWPHRFTRARCVAVPTPWLHLLGGAVLAWTTLAWLTLQFLPMAIGLLTSILLLSHFGTSRRNCLRAATHLLARAGRQAQLIPCSPTGKSATMVRPKARSANQPVTIDSQFTAEPTAASEATRPAWADLETVAVAPGNNAGAAQPVTASQTYKEIVTGVRED